MKLTVPLAFHLEDLAKQYGLIEIIHNLIRVLEVNPKYLHLILELERIRDEISKISRLEQIERANRKTSTLRDRPNNNPQTEEQL